MRSWGRTLQLYWCPSCNAPLRQEICERCGGKGFMVSVAEPGDIRPAFESDIKLIYAACMNEFGSDVIPRRLLVRGAVYLNKTPHYDDMKEVISGGTIIGRVYFDPRSYSWRWRLNRLSAKVAMEHGLVKVFRVNHVRPLMDLGPYNGGSEQAVVVDQVGEPIALAVVRRGRFRVQSIFKEMINDGIISKPSSFLMFRKCNEFWYRSRLSKAYKNLILMYEKTGLKPVVSYSGGKDSLVALAISLDSGIEPEVIFNDTGIELPSTISNVDEISKFFNINVITASARDKFWEAVRIFGPPARDYRWCCKVVKMAPIAKLYKNRYPAGLLAIIGQRAYESVDRSRSGYVWRNKWLPLALNIAPLQEWDQLSIWTYIIEKRLPVNELYQKGFERIGCYLCPAGNIAEYHFVESEFPELWRKWITVLEKWRRKLNEDELWVKYHLWRWLNPLSQGRRRLESWLGIREPREWIKVYQLFSGLKVKLSTENNIMRLTIEPKINIEVLEGEEKILGAKILYKKNNLILLSAEHAKIRLSENNIEIEGRDALKYIIKTLKIIIRKLYCCGCGICSLWCPTGAIVMRKGKPYIINTKCIGCETCVEVCPITKIFVEKLLITQMLRVPKRREEGVPLMLSLQRLRRTAIKNEQSNYSLLNVNDFLRMIHKIKD